MPSNKDIIERKQRRSDSSVKLDPRTLDELSPRDQGLCLLALIAMDDMGISIEDVLEDRHHANRS